MVYGNSDTDMLVAMPCPSPTSITDGLSPRGRSAPSSPSSTILIKVPTRVGWRLLEQPLDLHFHLPSLLH
jgi:hypothetical protein